MLKRAIVAVFLLGSLPAVAGTTAEIDQAVRAYIGDPAQFQLAFDAIRKAVAADDAVALARWVEYPINVRIGNTVVTIRDVGTFIDDYEEVFSDAMKAAI